MWATLPLAVSAMAEHYSATGRQPLDRPDSNATIGVWPAMSSDGIYGWWSARLAHVAFTPATEPAA